MRFSLDQIPQYLSLVCLLSSISLQAAQPFQPEKSDPNLESWRWTKYPFLEGRGITCMAENPEGIYWFGGDQSIYRYDGYSVTEFSRESGLQGEAALTLATAPDNTLYAGTNQGLYRFDNERWTAIVASETKQSLQIRDIDFLPDGSLLASIGEREENEYSSQSWHGLLHVKGSTIRLHNSSPRSAPDHILKDAQFQYIPVPAELAITMLGQPELNVSSSLLASDGLLYCAITQNNRSENHLATFQYDPKTSLLAPVKTWDESDGLVLDDFTTILEPTPGEIWVSCNNAISGIFKWDGLLWSELRLSSLFPGAEAFFYAITASDGSVWIDGFGQYFVHKAGEWKSYHPPDIPISSSNRINFFESADGSIWLLATNSSVFRLDYSERTWDTLSGLIFETENSANSELWYLSEKGQAIRQRDSTWVAFSTNDGLIDTPTSLYATSYGETWAIGSHHNHAALAYFRDESWIILEFPDLSWAFDHRSAYEAKDGSLYFASAVDAAPDQSPGVIRFLQPETDKTNWRHYGQEGPFSSKQSYYGIGESDDGRLWNGGRPAGVIKDDQQVIPPEFPDRTLFIDHIFNDPTGGLWLLTRSKGILNIHGGQSQWHNIDTGLPTHSLVSGYASSANDIWVITNENIIHFDGKSWNEFFKPPLLRFQRSSAFLHQARDQRLFISQASNHWLRRGLDNNAYLLGSENFQTFIYQADNVPPVVSIGHFDSQVGTHGNTTIYWQGVDYLETTPQEKLEYSYKLDADEWSPFRIEQQKLFLGLLPGQHRIQVRARDHSFNISPEIAAATFDVQAPAWRQLWFQTIIALLAGLAIYFYWQALRRSRRLTNLNVDLFSANTRLHDQQGTIAKQNEALEKQRTLLEDRVNERTADLEAAKLKAEESDRLKSAFLSNMSHEIRTPMNAIIGFSELLAENPTNIQDNIDFLDSIRSSGRDLLKLIDDIIEVAKIESGQIDTEIEDASVEIILLEIQQSFAGVLSKFGRKNLQILLDKEQIPPGCVIRTDPARLKQILKNLVSNAIKFTPDGFIRIGCAPSQDRTQLEFYIEDTGYGIKPDQLAIIFERFRKGEANAGHSFRGSGLGLAISQNLIAKLGGAISVKSEPGKGSTFSVTHPWDGRINALPATNSQSPLDQIPKLHFQHPLLVVEDEETNFHLISTILRRLGLEFVHVTTGERAIDLCQQNRFSAILMDIKLPGIPGNEAARRIRAFDQQIPIIAQTALAMANERETYSRYPFNAYLSKPLTQLDIAKTLAALDPSKNS